MKLLLPISFLLISLKALATNYYVAVGGSDANNGTSAGSAWASMTKVNGHSFSPGDSILFNGGDIWRDSLVVSSNGLSGNPIVFSSYGTGKPIFSGANIYSSWTFDGSYYYTPVSVIAKFVFDNSNALSPVSAKTSLAGGKFYFDTTNVRVYINYNPSGHTMEVSQRDNEITVSKNYVNINGLQIQGANYAGIKGNGAVSMSNNFLQYNCSFGIFLHTTFLPATISNNTVKNISGHGIEVYDSHLNIYGNTVDSIGVFHDAVKPINTDPAGINLSVTDSSDVHDNTISNVLTGGDNQNHGVYIADNSTNINVYNNTVHDCIAGDGIKFATNGTIYGNTCYNNSVSGIGVHDNTNYAMNVIIHNNLCYNNGAGGLNEYGMVQPVNLTIYNNTFYKNGSSRGELYIGNNVTSAIIKDNILYSNNNSDGLNLYGIQSNLTSNYNILWNDSTSNVVSWGGGQRTLAAWKSQGYDLNSINSNPQLKSNYHLLYNSPARNAGVNVGNGTDIGAFAYTGTTYYINHNAGNDASPGTATGAAWLTLNNINSGYTFNPGDSILLARGSVWNQPIIIHFSGAAGAPIYIGAYGSGANPVITGFQTVSGWTNLGGNIWESTSAVSTLNDLNMVLINGVNTPMGRTPNTGWWNIDSHSGNTSLTSTSLSGTNFTGGDVVLKPNHFSLERNVITSTSGTTITYVLPTTSSAATYAPTDNFGFFIQNDSLTLDQQNEWWYSPSRKVLRIYSTTSPTNVQVSTLDTLVYMTNKSYLTFDGIDFTGSNRRAFYIGSCSNITIQNCNITNHGLYGIWGGNNYGSTSYYLNVNHNYFNQINSAAIDLGSEFFKPYIGYNTIKNVGMSYGMFKVPTQGSPWSGAFFGVLCSGTDSMISEHNFIDSIGYDGINANGQYMQINNNEVSHFDLNLNDGGGINIIQSNNYNRYTKIYNNALHDGHGDMSGTTDATRADHGGYFDVKNRRIQFYNNSCYNNSYGFGEGLDDSCSYHDNNFYNNTYAQFFSGGDYGTDGSTKTHTMDSLYNNKLTAKDSTQRCYVIWSNTLAGTNALFSYIDNNYIARPIKDTINGAGNGPIEVVTNNFANYYNYALNGWQSGFTPFDAHSHKSPKTITDPSQIILVSNTTTSSKTTSLSATYEGLDGVNYTSVTVAPYSSITLLYLSALNNILKITHGGKIILK